MLIDPKIKLGVNIDHIATLREARKTTEPRLLETAFLAESAGCHSITVHPREDGRHVQKNDITLLKEHLHVPLNVELANTNEMINFIIPIKPHWVCLVPEKREEVTTEGGLSISTHQNSLIHTIKKLQSNDIMVSVFIDADNKEIEAAYQCNVNAIELHTGEYANAFLQASTTAKEQALNRLKQGVKMAKQLGLTVNLGHGITYHNLAPLLTINNINEFNIGHSIISRATTVGLKAAVKEMLSLLGY